MNSKDVDGAGAVFLLDWSQYGIKETEHRLRILILTEAGKAAVQLDPFSPLLSKVEGRTVTPDGKELEFNKAQDFTDQVVNRGSDNVTRKVLIPPGLTDHCLVDLHWIENGTVLWNNQFERWLQRSYPIQQLEIRLSMFSPLNAYWFWPNGMALEKDEDTSYHIRRFKKVPALESEPYSREAWCFRPKLIWFLSTGSG